MSLNRQNNFEAGILGAIALSMGSGAPLLGPRPDTSGNKQFKSKKAARKRAKQAKRKNRR